MRIEGDDMSFSSAPRLFIDQRQVPRRRVVAAAWVDPGDGSGVRDCSLWDVSEAGVRITIDAPGEVPREFLLLLSSDGVDSRQCQVIWRSDRQIGARYLGAPARN
jgi:hypothetical protein